MTFLASNYPCSTFFGVSLIDILKIHIKYNIFSKTEILKIWGGPVGPSEKCWKIEILGLFKYDLWLISVILEHFDTCMMKTL